MSVESLTAVLHHSRAKGTAKLVLVGIANHDGDGGAWPTVATLMRYANVDRRNVQRAVDRLVELGELTVLDQQGGTPGQPDELRPNLYRVNVCCPESCDRTPQHRDRRTPRALQLGGAALAPPGSGASATGGAAAAPPGGAAPAPPKPSREPTVNPVGTSPQHAREDDEDHPRPRPESPSALRLRRDAEVAAMRRAAAASPDVVAAAARSARAQLAARRGLAVLDGAAPQDTPRLSAPSPLGSRPPCTDVQLPPMTERTADDG